MQIAHDRIELDHAVGDRGPRGEGNALSAGQFVQILTLHEHVAGLLRVRLGDACDVAHLRIEKQILVKMAFIHKKPVHAQLFEGHYIILPCLVIEFGQPRFQHAAGLFHLFNGIALAALVFGLIDR